MQLRLVWGGIVLRHYLYFYNKIERIQKIVFISVPQNGTYTGYLSNIVSAQQMRPNSPLLQQLNRTIHTLKSKDIYSYWTPFDLMIFPAHSSILPFGKHTKVHIPFHTWMRKDKQVLQAITNDLR